MNVAYVCSTYYIRNVVPAGLSTVKNWPDLAKKQADIMLPATIPALILALLPGVE